MKFGLEPIAHIPPRPRIAMNEPKPADPNVKAAEKEIER